MDLALPISLVVKKGKKKWVTCITYDNVYVQFYVEWPLWMSAALITVRSEPVAMEERSSELELVMFEIQK